MATPKEKYLAYLEKAARRTGNKKEVHEEAISKEIAKSYGLSERELREIAASLK